MKRTVKPAASSSPGYPALEAARKILRGAAFASGLFVCGAAIGDTTPPPSGHRDGNLAQVKSPDAVVVTPPRPSGGPPAPVPKMKGEMARPIPPMPGQMARPIPPTRPQPPQPPQPPPQKRRNG